MFFGECIANGALYWDGGRLVQNMQDVEKTKKIVTIMDEVTNKTEKPNLVVDVTMDYGDNDENEDRDLTAPALC
jgi:hypothetical protein